MLSWWLLAEHLGGFPRNTSVPRNTCVPVEHLCFMEHRLRNPAMGDRCLPDKAFLTVSYAQISNGQDVIIMELCNGGSLHHFLREPENYYGLEENEFICVLKNLGWCF